MAAFKLRPQLIQDWAPLCWVAHIPKSSGQFSSEVFLSHGRNVEVRAEWAVEGVWPGQFATGDFDRADLFFGSGVRIRDSRVSFVSTNSTLSRLVSTTNEQGLFVSNSLPALLVCSGGDIQLDYLDYRVVLDRLKLGRPNLQLTVPLQGGDVTYTMLDDLIFDGESLELAGKSDSAHDFVSFDDYYHFMSANMEALGQNLVDPTRSWPVIPVAAISNGYDSPTVAALSRHAGCKLAFTLDRARAWKDISDSGAEIAQHLGMQPQVYERDPQNFKDEASIWAALGDSQDLNLTIFDYPQPVSVLFSGFFGDALWERDSKVEIEQLRRLDTAGMSTCEFRLWQGTIHCPVAFWAYRHGSSIKAISSLPEMAPWTLGTAYDRPICRRILETAGVPRGSFALRKSATSVSDERIWPYSEGATASFVTFLKGEAKCSEIEIQLANLSRFVNAFDREFLLRLRERFRLSARLSVEYQTRANKLIFHWANRMLMDRYRTGLAS